MGKRLLVVWLIIVTIALFPLYISPVRSPQSQVMLETVRVILNRFWDRSEHALVTTGPVEAQGVIETETTIWNDICNRDADGRCAALNIVGITGSTPSATTGIRTTATSVNTIRYTDLHIAGNFTAGLNSVYYVTVGTAGSSIQLPDASLPTTPGYYEFIIEDTGTGSMTIVPFGTDLINDLNVSPPAIKGQWSSYTLLLRSTGWFVREVSNVGYGAFVTNICSRFGGNTNTDAVGAGSYFSHSLTCVVPANRLTVGSTLRICNIWRVVTGTDGPLFFWDILANAAPIAGNATSFDLGNSITNRKITHCVNMVVEEAPNATGDISVAPMGDMTSLNTAGDASGTAEPVTIASNTEITFTARTQFTTDTTGTNTIEQLAMTVEASRLAN